MVAVASLVNTQVRINGKWSNSRKGVAAPWCNSNRKRGLRVALDNGKPTHTHTPTRIYIYIYEQVDYF